MIKKFKDFCYKKQFELDLLICKLFYKNFAGYKLNKMGHTRWATNRHRLGFPRSENFPLGYHVFKITNEGALKSVKELYNHIINDKEHASFSALIDGKKSHCAPADAQFMMVKNIVKSVPNVLDLLSKDVLDVIYQYYNSHFRISYVSAIRTVHVGEDAVNNEVHAYKFHYDRHMFDTLKLFVLLTDVTHDDGPFTFFDREDSKKILAAGYKDRDNYGKAEQLIESGVMTKYLVGTSGTAGICDTATCLHRASVPEPGRVRDLLIFSFESCDMPLDISSPSTLYDVERLIDKENIRY